MIQAINPIQNKNYIAFKANVPETLGKKACDKMAKQFLEKGSSVEQDFAKKYFSSIKKIKKEKNIDEVLLCATNRASSMPYISADGFHISRFDIVKNGFFAKNPEKKTLMLMDCVNFAADTLENVIISIESF